MRLVVSSISFEIFSFSSSCVSGFSSMAFSSTMRASSAAMKSAICFFSASLCAQLVVGEFLDRGVDGLDLLQIRLDLFAVLVGFRAEEGFDYTCNYIHNAFIVFSVRVLNLTKITSFLELRNS